MVDIKGTRGILPGLRSTRMSSLAIRKMEFLELKNGFKCGIFFQTINGLDDPIYTPIHWRSNCRVDLVLDGIEICCQCSSEIPESEDIEFEVDIL